MLEQFLNHINSLNLCEKTDRILLAVSGGIDSMAMLYLFQEAGYSFGVAHCNFQLRGKESEGDEQFVHQVCKELGLPVFIKRFETEAYAWENSLSTQMAARALRYAWFEQLLSDHHYQRLATGHHLDDSMETIILNITRGASTEGLAGIAARNEKIIRPLLFATKKSIEKYAVLKGIVWREDQSNLTDDYQRNFIRHQVIPLLRELNPSLETTWQNGIEKIQGDLSLMQHAYDAWKSDAVVEESNRISILKSSLASYLQPASLLWRFGRTLNFNFEQCKEVIRSLHGQAGKRFFSSTHLLVIDRDHLVVTPHQEDWSEESIDKGQAETILGPYRLNMKAVTVMSPLNSDTEAVLDGDALQFPLIWRKWRPGDSFYPLGMTHHKKLSDFLIDSKVSVADKESVTVLESGGQVAWVVGRRIDDRFKLTESTRSPIKFTLTPK
jgi:tRNA(Ile)-lysidine synthase